MPAGLEEEAAGQAGRPCPGPHPGPGEGLGRPWGAAP